MILLRLPPIISDSSDEQCDGFGNLSTSQYVAVYHDSNPKGLSTKLELGLQGQDGTYVCSGNNEYQSEYNIPTNTLILNSELLCLQSTNGDSEGKDEVEQDQNRECVVKGFDGHPKLDFMLAS